MRLSAVAPEYEGRVRLVERAFPLEIYGGGPPNKRELEQEWWLAALQEPAAEFRPYENPNWPETTLPAFEAAWCARQQDEAAARRLDVRIRRAFFAESADLSRRDLYPELAREVGLEMPAFNRLFESSRPLAAVLEEGRMGKEQYGVRGTPTLLLSNGLSGGARLRHPIAFPRTKNERVVSVTPLPCCGDGCYAATRALFERALEAER